MTTSLSVVVFAPARAEENNGEDFTRPPGRIDFRYQFEEKSGDVSQDTFILRADYPFQLGDGWQIATRVDLPGVDSDASSRDNPTGHYQFGLGDLLTQAALIKELNDRWAAGLGTRVYFPTATQDQFGTGKYQVCPIGGVRCFLPEITKGTFAELIALYKCDVGGYGGRSHISQFDWSPTLNLALKRDWYIILYPSQDIVVDFKHGAQWFVPADFAIGKNLSRRMVTSLEISIPILKQYDLYNFKLEARLSYFF